MGLKKKLTVVLKDKHKHLLSMGTQINHKGKNYHFLPFCFVSTDDSNIFELVLFENLPEDFIETLKGLRDGKITNLKENYEGNID